MTNVGYDPSSSSSSFFLFFIFFLFFLFFFFFLVFLFFLFFISPRPFTTSHVGGKAVEFKWHSDVDDDTPSISGWLNTYPGGGYVEDIPGGSMEAAKAKIEALKEAKWINLNTRAFIVELTVYNPSRRLYVTVYSLVEMPRGGSYLAFGEVQTFPVRLFTSFLLPLSSFYNLYIGYYNSKREKREKRREEQHALCAVRCVLCAVRCVRCAVSLLHALCRYCVLMQV